MRSETVDVNQAAETEPLTRRRFMSVAAMLAPGLCGIGPEGAVLCGPITKQADLDEHNLTDEIKKEKIRRAMLAGPSTVTAESTVAEIDRQGNLTVLRQGTNEWVCVPGDQNIVGKVDMVLDPMGMVWFKDLLARKPKPTNTSPGLIYMLNGATQRSFTDPFDTTSPSDSYRAALDDSLAFRRESGRSFGRHAGCWNNGDVCGNSLCAPAHLRVPLGGKRIPSR